MTGGYLVTYIHPATRESETAIFESREIFLGWMSEWERLLTERLSDRLWSPIAPATGCPVKY